jgi:hypothetical protein
LDGNLEGLREIRLGYPQNLRGQYQMRGRGDWQELGKALDQTENERRKLADHLPALNA